MWLLFSIISGVLASAQSLIARMFLKNIKDAKAFSFYFSIIGSLVTFPFALSYGQFSRNIDAWIILLIICVLIVIHNWLFFAATKYIEPSIQSTVNRFRLIWIFLVGVLIFSEATSPMKLIGTVLTISAGIVLISKYRTGMKLRGIIFMIICTLISTLVVASYKPLMTEFNGIALGFLVFLFPAVIIFIALPDRFNRIVNLYRNNNGKKWLILSGVCGGLGNLAVMIAFQTGELSRVVVVTESFLFLTLIGEAIILKERSNLKLKVLAVILSVIGAILVQA